MIRRLYVHNYRCMENFEIKLEDRSSALLIGGNGSGKSTGGRVLQILQRVARGDNHVDDLVNPEDFTAGKVTPMRFEIEAALEGRVFRYTLAFELPPRFKALRVLEEALETDGRQVYQRDVAQVTLDRGEASARFLVDWHQVALSIIQAESDEDPLAIFRSWLRRMLVLAPVPSRMSGDTTDGASELDRECSSFGRVLSELFKQHPAAWTPFEQQLKATMPDVSSMIAQGELTLLFRDEGARSTGGSSKVLSWHSPGPTSDKANGTVRVPFRLLSDGERCFVLGAYLTALLECEASQLCFWDEPDSFLSLPEVGHFISDLRRGFKRARGGQLLITSHREETIRRFGDTTTLVLHRASHMEPTQVAPLSEFNVKGDLVSTLIRGDL